MSVLMRSAKEECRKKLLFQANLYHFFANMPPAKSIIILNDTNSDNYRKIARRACFT